MSEPHINTGDIYRVYVNFHYNVYRVVGVYLGGIGTENLIELEPLSYDKGSTDNGKMNAFVPPSLVHKMEKIQ